MATGNTLNLTRSAVTVTDGAEVTITVLSPYCAKIQVYEDPSATGWPRQYLVRGSAPTAVQNRVTAGWSYIFPGPFTAGDIAGKLELVSAGGDTSSFYIQELAS